MFKICPKKRNPVILFIQIFFIILILAIVLKLIELQVIDPKHLKEKAKEMRASKSFIYRGEIVDRNGIRLATDRTLYDIYAHPIYYQKAPKDIAAALSPLLKISEHVLFKKLNKLDYSTITLVKDIDRSTIQKINKLNIRGLDLVRKNVRVYPQGNLASHILGYVNFDADISAGVENIASKGLETLPQTAPIEKNGYGEIIYDFNTNPEYAAKPLKGEKITLTIDSAIQHISEIELEKMIIKTKADRGTVIVMNPKNGEILGFAVYPSYNPNKYNNVDPSVVKNWVLSDVSPPGSTFKILTVASALDTGRITEDEKIFDSGKVEIQGWSIKNYDYGANPEPGFIDLEYLFEHSSNVGSLKVALSMTPEEHRKKLELLGIGKKTGIDLPGESAGILPEVKTWDTVRQATIGFGYSIASTPLQIASAVGAIANNGIWITPHVIKYREEDYEAKIHKKRVLSQETTDIITKKLEKSIRNSKSKAGKISNFTVAGKTGTARKPNPNGGGYLKGQVYTSFVGYFPSENPEVLMMVVVDNPKGYDVWGSTVAGPIFNEVATQITRLFRMQPDEPGLNVSEK